MTSLAPAAAEGIRTCTKCSETKTTSDFYFDKSRGGFLPSCRSCVKARVSLWRKNNPEKAAAYNRISRGKNPALWRAHALARYGLTMDDYDAMLSEQGGTCAICCNAPGKRALSVDHDHDTGAVRGLLCGKCNTAIGVLHNEALLDAAREYLK